MSHANLTSSNQTSLKSLSSDQISALSVTSLKALSSDQISALSVTSLKPLTSDQIGALDVTSLKALSSDQISALSVTSLKSLSSDQISALSHTQVAAFNSKSLSQHTNQLAQAIQQFAGHADVFSGNSTLSWHDSPSRQVLAIAPLAEVLGQYDAKGQWLNSQHGNTQSAFVDSASRVLAQFQQNPTLFGRTG